MFGELCTEIFINVTLTFTHKKRKQKEEGNLARTLKEDSVIHTFVKITKKEKNFLMEHLIILVVVVDEKNG